MDKSLHTDLLLNILEGLKVSAIARFVERSHHQTYSDGHRDICNFQICQVELQLELITTPSDLHLLSSNESTAHQATYTYFTPTI